MAHTIYAVASPAPRNAPKKIHTIGKPLANDVPSNPIITNTNPIDNTCSSRHHTQHHYQLDRMEW
jgi:hypothetical protein